VLEHLGTGERTVLGDVTDQQQHGTALLRGPRQAPGALAHLRHAPRGGRECLAEQHLDRIDHEQARAVLIQRRENALQGRLRHQAQVVAGQVEALGTRCHLLRTLLTGDVQGGGTRREVAHGLQQQRALAGARVAAHENGGARHQAAAEHAIELGHARTDACHLGGIDVREAPRRGQGTGIARARRDSPGARAGAEAHLAERVPGAAVAALALPLVVIGAALAAHERGFLLSHGTERPQNPRCYN
jgi:hypothetical protein